MKELSVFYLKACAKFESMFARFFFYRFGIWPCFAGFSAAFFPVFLSKRVVHFFHFFGLPTGFFWVKNISFSDAFHAEEKGNKNFLLNLQCLMVLGGFEHTSAQSLADWLP